MRFDVPADFCELPTDVRTAILKSAETALSEKKQVFFQGHQFTNQDELVRYVISYCAKITPEADWPGVVLDN
jgi:hypothetical protein